jgi:uncharacterized protein DUF6894
MPRFYFNFVDGHRIFRDEQGTELGSVDLAREEALGTVRDALANAVRSGQDVGADALVVMDERGAKITSVPISEALPMRIRFPRYISSVR